MRSEADKAYLANKHKRQRDGSLIRFHPWRGAYLFKVTVSVCYLVGG